MQMNQNLSEIRRQIEHTRARMGETIDAIAYKLDVPNRVRDRVNDTMSTAKQKVAEGMSTAKEVLRNGIDSATGAAGSAGANAQSERPARGS